MIHLKRIYEDYEESDGYRILVDRIWPRGISKEHAHLDLWLKAIAPSTEVRKTFGHQSENFPSFVKAYRQELQTDTARGTSPLPHSRRAQIRSTRLGLQTEGY